MHNDVEKCTCYNLMQRISQLIKSIYINFLEHTVAFNSLQHSIILPVHLCLLTALATYTLQNTALPIPEWLCNFWEYATQTWPHNVGFKSHFLWQFNCLNLPNQSNFQSVNMFWKSTVWMSVSDEATIERGSPAYRRGRAVQMFTVIAIPRHGKFNNN